MPVAAVVESTVPQFAEVLPPQHCTVTDSSSKTVLKCKNITVELSENITDHLLMRLIKVLSYVCSMEMGLRLVIIFLQFQKS